ncbi:MULTISPECIES: hypothetical protein [Cysteiniphilum]|uniref:hypothetical protein n=1 Tax=Cysteiniphilum TaxID=2056696 RepID=UPI00177B5441|nr:MULTISPECIES: hypothetical protein [Cysteiniphilum]
MSNNSDNTHNSIKIIQDIAVKNGYLLEFEVCQSIDKLINKQERSEIRMGELIGRDNIEVDIIAAFFEKNYMIECKGAQEGTNLILVKAPKSICDKDNDTTKSYSSDVVCQLVTKKHKLASGRDINYRVINFNIKDGQSAPYTINGNFHQMNSNKCFDSADSRNNFYKAQQQICQTMENFSPTPLIEGDNKPYPSIVIPIIATNADIWVIDYETNSGSDINPVIKQYDWAIHRVVNRSQNIKIITNSELQHTSPIMQVLIVNKHKIESLIKFLNTNIKIHNNSGQKLTVPTR